eukprot:6233683-Pyramimonas_sp.AAC.1
MTVLGAPCICGNPMPLERALHDVSARASGRLTGISQHCIAHVVGALTLKQKGYPPKARSSSSRKEYRRGQAQRCAGPEPAHISYARTGAAR